MKRINNTPISLIILSASFVLSACSPKEEEFNTNKDIAAEVEAYYKAHPDFFSFATPNDLPKDLKWENGSEEPEIGSPKAKKGGTLHSFLADYPRTFRFLGPDANGAFRRYIHDQMTMSLVTLHPNTGNPIPGLATEWAIGEDKRTVYFKLDPKAHYSDGTPIKADNYFFTFFFMQSKYINAPWYNDYYTTKFSNITKYSDYMISITGPKAKPDILTKLAVYPVPQHFYNELGDDYVKRYQWRLEPTTGPYTIENLDRDAKDGKYIIISRVKNWWAKDMKNYRYRYNPDKIRLTVIRDPNKAFEAFKKGDIDWHGLSLPEYWYKKLPDDIPEVANGYIHKVTFYNDIPRPTWALRINAHKPLLNNREIRVGLHHAMNWDLVLKEVFKGDYSRMQTVADGYGKQSHPTLKARPFSVEKAEEYFAKAGFNKRGPDGILVNEKGERLSFTLTTGYKRLTDVTTVLKQEAVKAGVELNLEILEMTSAWKKSSEKKHEISLGGLNNSVEMYPRFWEPYHSDNAYKGDGSVKPNTNNETMTADPEIDALIDEYRAAESIEDIRRLSHTLIEKLHEHAAYIPSWVKPWYRVGHWRWVHFPDDFNFKLSRDFEEAHVHWIDEDMKKETLEAKKSNKNFPPQIKVYDQYRKN